MEALDCEPHDWFPCAEAKTGCREDNKYVPLSGAKGLGTLCYLTPDFPCEVVSQVFPRLTLTAHSEQRPNLTCGLPFHGPGSQVQMEPSGTLLRAVQVDPPSKCSGPEVFGILLACGLLYCGDGCLV